TEIKIEKVWMTPLLAWSDPSGQEVLVTAKDIAWVPDEDGGQGKKKKGGRSGESLLVVQVEFQPSKNEPRNILLRDWHLDSVIKDKKSKKSKKSRTPPRTVKLWMNDWTKSSAVIPDVPSTKKKDMEILVHDASSTTSGGSGPPWSFRFRRCRRRGSTA
ncbi:MAG: hypothetical protein GWP05_10540, partial [Anaerolineaceae bacterium]|nr:hypothetical protein [Anaerolineaceae bacterium]